MPVTGYTKIDDNDFEKLIPLAQAAAAVPVKRLVDDGDIAAQITALQVAAGIPANERNTLLDRKDWEKKLLSLQGRLNARTATITIASPAVVSLASHGFAINQAIKFASTGALPTGLTIGPTYYVATPGFGAGAFQVSGTPGGASINTSGTQSGVHSVYAA
jgi:hypothetical protein